MDFLRGCSVRATGTDRHSEQMGREPPFRAHPNRPWIREDVGECLLVRETVFTEKSLLSAALPADSRVMTGGDASLGATLGLAHVEIG